ncbi:MAG: cyanoexosortase B system-associated protein [Leptolyngbyaceae cyanobacterium SM2_5_2]|nr:cyanoexosortase B system-associated protein [Leptolyngbyaceae cyanobacterium SM2_5_2]
MTPTPHPSSPSPPLHPWPTRWVKRGILVWLAVLAVVAIAPAYWTGQWPWVVAPQVTQIDRLQPLREKGLTLPGWTLESHQVITINKQEWGLNEYVALDPTAPVQQLAVVLHPQPWHSNQPQVEWMDLAGAQNWQVDSRQRLTFRGAADGDKVQANFFRGRSDHQAFVVLQWYAWPDGGHPSPSRWFWANQQSQLTTRTLTPWVAIAVLLPIPPLADLNAYESLTVDLGGLIHQQAVAVMTSQS